MSAAFRIEKLNRSHDLSTFDCGAEALNSFLTRFALANQQANASQTYVGLKGDLVIGFYSLVVGEVRFDDAPDRMKKGLARHPVPFMLLARLAVDLKHQGIGAGVGLLKDAALRTQRAADIAGIRALVVHAKDETAKRFYQHFGFIDGFANDMQLFMLIKQLTHLLPPTSSS